MFNVYFLVLVGGGRGGVCLSEEWVLSVLKVTRGVSCYSSGIFKTLSKFAGTLGDCLDSNGTYLSFPDL